MKGLIGVRIVIKCPISWSLTGEEREVRGAGDGEVRRRNVFGLDAIAGHAVQVWRVYVAVVIPAEAVEGHQQDLLPGGEGGGRQAPSGP